MPLYMEDRAMTMRIVAILLCLWVSPVWAAEGSGGPVRTTLTVANERIDVDVSWLQTGGVVLLKIVSTEAIPEQKRGDLARAASKLLRAGSVNKVLISDTGKLVASYRLTGWDKPFTAEDLTKGNQLPQSAP
jgi:hypothetical protein